MNDLLVIPDAMTPPTTWPPAEGVFLKTPYELDPFQKHAVLGIHAGDHVFVAAKTGSGKTLVGEYLIARALAAGKRVFYTTPIKSLSNQKYHDLKKLFPEATVGILTGDIKMQPDAQVVVMTAEILRNLFYKRGTATEGVGLTAAVSLDGVAGIVMDEAHYIQDTDRGHVWEETLILCPRDIQLVLLSATMPSAESLCGWLARLHQKRVWMLSTTYRIVPLSHGILRRQADGSFAVATMLDTAGRWEPDAYSGWLRDRRAVQDAADAHAKAVLAAKGRGGSNLGSGSGAYWSRSTHDSIRDGVNTGLQAGKVRVEDPMARLRRTVGWLKDHGALPALFFIFSRRECERLAGQIEDTFLDGPESAAATHIIDFHLSRHRPVLEKSPQFHRIRDLLVRGIAFHHSGLMPLLKEIVEILFSRGLVRLLFATETFSVGLNMPTKTVVFLELRKYCEEGEQRLLRPDEYIQMAGRAGRRGKDKQGLVLYEPLREPVEALELRSLLTGSLPALESRMRFHYDFILHHRLTGGKVSVAEDSYWAAQQRAGREAAVIEMARLAADMEAVGLSDGDRAAMEEKGRLEEAVKTAKNATQRKAKAALEMWASEHLGGRWATVAKLYGTWMQKKREYDRIAAEVASFDAAPLLQLEPQEAALKAWGFLDDSGSLTQLGLCGTEVAEGHCILMPLLAAGGALAELTAEEIACVLAGFLRESGGRVEPSLSDSGLRPEALAALYWVDRQVGLCMRAESVASPVGFWDLSTLWVCIAARWLAGAGLTEIATEFELFEGNVQRGLLRIANLLEEWATICEIRRDLEGLEKIRGVRFLRDELIVDSLYLRL
jgi:superfamily II RNA helicase